MEIAQFSCPCGAQAEGQGDPPPCWLCNGPMRQWGTRTSETASTTLTAKSADKRTANGGY